MANYIFEQMTPEQAAGYNPASDALFFLTGSPASIGVVVNPASGLTNASVTLTNGAVSHTFGADALAGETFTFFGASSNDTLAFGANSSGDTVTLTTVAGTGSRYFGLGGDDEVTGSNANDTIFGGAGDDTINGQSNHLTSGKFDNTDYLNGGAGNDVIIGGNGNDHIYGNDQTAVAGSADGSDFLSGGNGKDYIQGNAGDDSIDGGLGDDRLYGGSGNDVIDGSDGADYLQGNKGEDTLLGGNGNDVIHGGADNDLVLGGVGFDTLYGDLGKDTFHFATGDNGIANLTSAATAADHGLVDVIMDFTHGTDLIQIGFHPAAAANVVTSSTNFANITDAYNYAKTQIDSTHASNVEALQVGTDTVLFYDSGHTTGVVDSAILLHGVTASTVAYTDIIA